MRTNIYGKGSLSNGVCRQKHILRNLQQTSNITTVMVAMIQVLYVPTSTVKLFSEETLEMRTPL